MILLSLVAAIAGCGDSNNAQPERTQERDATSQVQPEPSAKQNRESRLAALTEKAEKGDVSAMLEVARAFDYGRGWGRPLQFTHIKLEGSDPLVDVDAATKWYEKAAQLGNIPATAHLGRLAYFAFQEGNNGQLERAIELFQKSAANGDPIAQFGLGIITAKGDGLPQDEAKARELVQGAADKGLPDAQNAVGGWYSEAYFGVAKDPAEAVRWWKLAADNGSAFSQLSLGQAYRDGKGVPKDANKALEWYSLSAAQGLWPAQFFIGMEYLKSHNAFADNVLAYAWLNLGSAKGDSVSTEWRDKAARSMTPQEISEAQRLSSNWKVGTVIEREGQSTASSKSPVHARLVKAGTGTAFLVNQDRQAVTNHHVVDGCTEVRAEGRDGIAKVAKSDTFNDLALLELPGQNTSQATIASDPQKLRQGEDIVVFGFPLSAVLSSGGNLTPGVISALTGVGNNTNQIQITAPIQPGSSGSPVMNRKGEVVGVVAMKLSDAKMAKATGQVGQNVNFAVSGLTLKSFLDTHKITYRSSGMFSFGTKSNADLADEARTWTVVVECWK